MKAEELRLSRFVNPYRLAPYEQFVATVRRSRRSMEGAYLEAWRASDASNALLGVALRQQLVDECGLDDFGIEAIGGDAASTDPNERKRIYAEAEAEDIQADQQASILILMADDALQRYARGLFGKAPSLSPGYGSEYSGVKLTTLLRAGTNTLRHASEWDEMFTALPYPSLASLDKKHPHFKPMQSIEVLQQVFGYAKNDFVRGPVSWPVVVRIDGKYGSEPPDYGRFQKALVTAAREVAQARSALDLKQLDDEMLRSAFMLP